MYAPAHFEETRTEVIHQLIRERPLATLVTLGAEGLTANHIPLDLDSEPGRGTQIRIILPRVAPLEQAAE